VDAPPESPAFNQIGAVATVSWSRGEKTYLLAWKDGGQTELMKLL